MIKIIKVKRYHFGKISIPDEFLRTQPLPEKLIHKTAEFYETGKLEKIYVDKDFKLVDGYCSYLIAKEIEVGKALKIRMIKN